MVTLDWQVAATGETTLVELFVTSDTETRVEIASNLEPVWPPRRQNRPVAGWNGSGFEGVVSAGEPLVLGYASPDDPVEPPATVVETEPVTGSSEGPPTPEALVRELGEAGPPRDAVPVHGSPSTDRGSEADSHAPGNGPTTTEQRPVDRGSTADGGHPSARGSATDLSVPADPHETGSSGTERAQTPGGGPETRSTQRSDHAGTGDRQSAVGSGSSTGSTQPTRPERGRTAGSTAGGGTASEETPSGGTEVGAGEAIDGWLDALGGRIETAERLAAVETAGEARAAVDAAGGIEQVRTLCERLDADRRRLERIEQRYGGFGDQLDEIEVPLSALERLV